MSKQLTLGYKTIADRAKMCVFTLWGYGPTYHQTLPLIEIQRHPWEEVNRFKKFQNSTHLFKNALFFPSAVMI